MKKIVLALLLTSGGLFSMEKGTPPQSRISETNIKTDCENIIRRFAFIVSHFPFIQKDTEIIRLLGNIQVNMQKNVAALRQAWLEFYRYEEQALLDTYPILLRYLLTKIDIGEFMINRESRVFARAREIVSHEENVDLKTIKIIVLALVDQLMQEKASAALSALESSKHYGTRPLSATEQFQRKQSKSGITAGSIAAGALDLVLRLGTGASGASRSAFNASSWQEDLEELARELQIADVFDKKGKLKIENPFEEFDVESMNAAMLRTRPDGLRFIGILEKCFRKNESTFDGPTYEHYSAILERYRVKWRPN